jgi:TatA/E family protein of Tat protein translocase
MFGIGMTELLVIMAVALVVFGPKRLPELARSLGRALGEFRHASNDLRQTLSETPVAPQAPPAASPTTPAVVAAQSAGSTEIEDKAPEDATPEQEPKKPSGSSGSGPSA